MKKDTSYAQQLAQDRAQEIVRNNLFKNNSKSKTIIKNLDTLENTIDDYHKQLTKTNNGHKKSKIESKISDLENSRDKLHSKKYKTLNKETDKIKKIKTEMSSLEDKLSELDTSDTKTIKLKKKVNKNDSKLSKIENSQEKLAEKSKNINQHRRKLRRNLESSFKTPFSAEAIGKRTLSAKAVTSPTKIAKEPIKLYHTELKREMKAEGAEGVQIAHSVVSPMSRKLKHETAQKVSKTVGFDRKATKLEKMELKSQKIERNELKLVKNQRKHMRKKVMYQKKELNLDLISSVICTFNKYKASFTSTATNIIKNKAMMFIAPSATIIVLGLFIALLPLIVVMGATGQDESGGNGINYEFDIDIDLESEHYQSASPFTAVGLRGQCTWFVWGRIREVFGIEIPANLGHGGQWLDSANNLPHMFITGSEPRAGSIMVSTNGGYGHVAFVESVDQDNNTMTVSEGNIGNPMNGTDQMAAYAHANYASLLVISEDVPINIDDWYDMRIVGYIYLDLLIDIP